MNDPTSLHALFYQLVERLVAELPEQVVSVNGEFRKTKLMAPESPLMVTTLVLEKEDGTLVPYISEL
jgi:hypothetical protein